ncbi:hypothetical protein BU26DRAFT_524450 [Trematosphaeria pertusa]|uniref:Uncharacterized protein n=1 Tax=Trematosphaeria pertusa TaxID=390896 RepID=A0A6A6HWY5_9PLEO|nr:uncharacterized protein BU26DRAFT_524450 [Trematosphaeria pertusa]KAF2242278.1 hypothetical protein BU26DRAFT_524450 [Trematosphaeria pertusa]
MVFDGLDNFEDFNRNIREYWPMSQFGTILVTSRHRDAELLGEPVKVDKLSDEQAVSLLQAKAGDWGSGYTQEEALQVVQELDSLCLPIVQAAVYIRQHRLTAEGFLTEYHVRQKKILETVPRAALWEYQKRKVLSEDEVRTALSVFTTWELSFQDLTGSKDERTCKVMALSLLAFLGIRSLTDAREIFEKHAASRTTHAEWLVIFKESGVWSSYAFRDVIHEFRDLSLINEVNDSKENPEISMHRIVRDWIQLRLEASSQRAITKEACSMTLSWIEDPQTKEGSWKLDEPYMFKQHALIPMISCVRNCERFLEPGETIGHGDLHDFGVLIFQYFINEGWYEETLALAGPALELSENGLGRWSIQTLELVEVLAVLHRNLGHYAQFHELGQWAFDAIHRVPEEPGNIRLRALMCRLLSLAGQACVEVANYKGGEWCLETAHEGLKQFLGVDHRSTLEAHLALARYYLVARRLNEAMTICALCSAYFDATHLGVMGKARARLLAAEIYLEKRHFVKAYRELQSLRFLCEVCYSPQHPERHRWLHLRGLVEIRRGKFKAAAEMFEHVYQVRKLHLGAQHLDTMQSQTWWARALMELGSFQQSEKILDEAQTTHSGLQTFPHLLFPSPTRLLIELHIMEASSHRRWAEALVPASMAIARFRGGHLLLPASEYPMLLWRTALLTYLALGPHPPFAIEFPGIGVFEPDPKTSLELLMRVAERLDLLDDYTALILFYCTAQNLFALLGDDAAANRYSLKLLETAMRQRSLGMPDGPGEDLSHASALQRPLPSPFATLCNWLIDGPRISRAYLLLGYALQRNGDFDAAQTAYELTPPSWYCDMCPSPETINGPVYICTACSDTALCMPCHGIYHSQEATGHTLASHRAPAGCHGHAFIRVPRDEWQRRPGAQPGTHESKDAIDAWLCRLQAQYSVASFDESASKRLNEFELADAEYRDVADLQPYAAPEIEQELRKGRLERVNGWWHPSGEVPRRAQGNPVLVEPGNLIFVGGVALVGDTVDRDARDGAVFEGSAEE